MPQEAVTIERVVELLPSVCTKETAAGGGAGWTPENPLWGHCAAVALYLQKRFGGGLERASLEGTPFASAGSHYRNRITGGMLWDATSPQFGAFNVGDLRYEHRDREPVIAGADTRVRYAKLALALAIKLHEGNPLFSDERYLRCLQLAYGSPCQKAGFGSLIVHPDGTLLSDNNHPIDALADLCQPTCIRMGIQSRTESMIGACGHGEEWVMRQARNAGWKLSECDLYVAGITAGGLPYFHPQGSHTCIRCSTQMHMAEINRIWVPTAAGEWAPVTTSQALADAKLYALGEKKV